MTPSLADHIKARRFVRVTRNRPACPRLNGYVLKASRHLCLMHCFHDFYPEGYSIVRTSDIEGVRAGEHETLWDRILHAEGLADGLHRKLPAIDLRSMSAAIASIQRHFGRLIVECEDEADDNIDFYIGYMTAATTSNVSMRTFDANGRWERKVHRIRPAEITLLQFETPYLETFWKHLESKPRVRRSIRS